MMRTVLTILSARAERHLAGLIEPALNHWVQGPLLDGGDADDDDDDDIVSLSQASSRALSLMFQGDLELESIFEDHGVCAEVIADSHAIERAIHERCVPGSHLHQPCSWPTGERMLPS